MNFYKTLAEILKANYGSSLSYDAESGEWVVTFTGNNGFRIPGNCEYRGEHIFKENSNKVVCKVKRE